MPELPEVETIVNDLNRELKGMKILDVSVSDEKFSVIDFCPIKGEKIFKVERRGKYLIFCFLNYFLLIHLRMTGRIFLLKKDKKVNFERVRFCCADLDIVFSDVRRFGTISLYENKDLAKISEFKNLGIDPLSEISWQQFVALFKGEKLQLKKILLNQRFLAGIGNIYADEICFESGISPFRLVSSLDKQEIFLLSRAIKKVLFKGVRNRGTSISDFLDPFEKKGFNQLFLNVYSRSGKDCKRCGGKLVSAKIAGRSTVYCVNCQN